MITLFIVRHGNTFDPNDTVLRVGARTDLPLSHSGKQQAYAVGRYFIEQQIQLDTVYTSQLQRTQMTATLALQAMQHSLPIQTQAMFNEVDYGPDEGQPETAVQKRLGDQALHAWQEQGIVPMGWRVDCEQIIQQWQSFLMQLQQQDSNKNVLVVTSQGIARFVFSAIRQTPPMTQSTKLATGALACLTYHTPGPWQIKFWNHRPVSRD